MPNAYGNHNHYIHGLSHTRIDNIYKSMISRCYNKNNSRYDRYGGRGIRVCNEWREDKTKFFDWAFSNGYKDSLTLDRIDTNDDYKPNNCRWCDYFTQENNKTTTIKLTVNGETHTISEWAIINGINRQTIWARLDRGWSPEDAISKKLKVNQYL